jgi:hypothetical protein
VVHDHDGDNELLEELEASAADEAAGNLVDFEAVIARLGSKPRRSSLPSARSGASSSSAIAGERIAWRLPTY